MKLGLQVFLEAPPEDLLGLKAGLVAHPASAIITDGRQRHAVDLLLEQGAVRLLRLFGPEHGLYGAAVEGEQVADGLDEHSGLPIVSLYGQRRAPEAEHLHDLDILLFDLQDVGVRCFTYVSTLKACLQACARANTLLVVLDRPNPLGRRSAGAGVAEGFASFVACHNLRFVHGLTMGELALTIARDLNLSHYLRVIPLTGYIGQSWEDTDLPWLPPSPALTRLELAQLYPLTVFFEGTNISEGRGTDNPFAQLGAPWLDGKALAADLRTQKLEGLEFEAVSFSPSRSKFAAAEVHGVRLKVHNWSAIQLSDTARALLATFKQHSGDRFSWLQTQKERFFLDLLYGATALRQLLEDSSTLQAWQSWEVSATELDDSSVKLYEGPVFRNPD